MVENKMFVNNELYIDTMFEIIQTKIQFRKLFN